MEYLSTETALFLVRFRTNWSFILCKFGIIIIEIGAETSPFNGANLGLKSTIFNAQFVLFGCKKGAEIISMNQYFLCK